jgi:hypothetical protein
MSVSKALNIRGPVCFLPCFFRKNKKKMGNEQSPGPVQNVLGERSWVVPDSDIPGYSKIIQNGRKEIQALAAQTIYDGWRYGLMVESSFRKYLGLRLLNILRYLASVRE